MALVKYNNNSISAITAAAAIPSGAMTHIKTLTASSSGTLSFVHGAASVVLDSTYPIYVFKFINIHRADGSEQKFEFNLSIDSGSNYNVTKTTTVHDTHHRENDTSATLQYNSSQDLAQSTAFQSLSTGIELGVDNDASLCGEFYLFNPSSTTFVKHFIIKTQFMSYYSTPWSVNTNVSGYGNTTSAVNAVRFQMTSGNIDAGKIKLYGIKDS